MGMSSEGQFLTIMGTPRPVPALVDRVRWPIHVTMAANFHVEDATAQQIPALLEAIANETSAFEVRLGPTDRFGTNADIPVLLARHTTLDLLHASLATSLMKLPDFTAAEPQHWLEGYRPHATLGSAVRAHEGEMLWIRELTLVSLQGAIGVRLASVRLS